MALKIFWTHFAKFELKKIYEFHNIVASNRIAKKLVSGIVLSTKNLSKQPEIGTLEELLLNKPQKFRYLVHKNYKMICRINSEKNQIESVTVFDCRQNSIKITRLK
jgi:plasmid stabilization system protein ParE